jgi:transposase
LPRENDPTDHLLILLILEGAGRHGSAARIVPDNLSLLTLPPDSPELKPVENVWHYLRANWLAIRVFDSCDAILDACCTAWNHFANNPKTVTSITERSWAQVD